MSATIKHTGKDEPPERLTPASLKEVEQTVRYFDRGPAVVTDVCQYRDLVADTSLTLAAWSAHRGPLQRRVWKVQAYVDRQLGRYEAASVAYDRLGQSADADEMRHRAQIKASLQRVHFFRLPILAIEPISPTRAVVLTAAVCGEGRPRGTPDTLHLIERTFSGWRRISDAKVNFDPDDTANMALIVGDFDHDGAAEAMVVSFYGGASWQPTRLAIFRTRPTLNRTFGAFSGDGILVSDRQGDGRYTVIVIRRVGGHLSNGEMPRWGDVYDVRRDGIRLASERHPECFQALHRIIIERQHALTAEERPPDGELARFRAITEALRGNKSAARHWLALADLDADPIYGSPAEIRRRFRF